MLPQTYQPQTTPVNDLTVDLIDLNFGHSLPWSSRSGPHQAAVKVSLIGPAHFFLEFGILSQAPVLLSELSSVAGLSSLFPCWL